jgi:peptidyl-prolyl cis-trans isomerase C
MSATVRLGKVVFVLATCLSWATLANCRRSQDQPSSAQERRGSLAEGVAAQVGGDPIDVSSVQRVAAAHQTSLAEARSRLVLDALFAAGARDRGLDRDARVAAAERSLLARALLEQIRDQASSSPITDQEVAEVTALHWLDLDRPVARSSVHALVKIEEGADAARRRQAHELAERMARALRPDRDPKAFEEHAKALPHEGFDVVVERLPPITQDGRLADLAQRPPPGAPTPTFDAGYVAGLFALEQVGDVSGPTMSAYGVHVILLAGVQAEQRVGFEERRTRLGPEIVAARARRELDGLTQRLRQQTKVEVMRNADSLFELLSTKQEGEGR